MALPGETLNKAQYLITIWVLAGVALAFITTRLLIRLKLDSRLKVDDGLVILAMVCLLASAILNSVMSPTTFTVQDVKFDGQPQPADYEELLTSYGKYQWANAYLFFTGIWAVKGSFLAYYDGLTQRLIYYRRAWWATIVITVLTYIGCLFAYAFLDGVRLKTESKNEAIKYQFSADFATDVLITIIPLTIAMKSRVPTRQKLILAGVFSLSLIITIFSIIRYALNSPDREIAGPSWIQAWSAVEHSVAVIVACLASFRALVISNSRQAAKAGAPGTHISGESSSRSRTGKSGFPQPRSRRSGSMDIELLEPSTIKRDSQRAVAVKEEEEHDAQNTPTGHYKQLNQF